VKLARALSLLLLAACGSSPPPPKPDAGPAPVDLSTMVHIPAGAFPMGHAVVKFDPYGDDFKENEFPQHQVTLSEYWIDRDEVTVSAYAAFLDAYGDPHLSAPMQPIIEAGGRYQPAPGFENDPIAFVSWFDAQVYCAFIGKTLPTEAQWERAAKGPSDDRHFPWGNTGPTCDEAVFLSSSLCELEPAAVGSRSPAGDSVEGVHDLAGNVAEWVSDWYDRYTADAQTDPTGPDNADGSLTLRVMRGGGFLDPEPAIRTTARWGTDPSDRAEGTGFRCVYRP